MMKRFYLFALGIAASGTVHAQTKIKDGTASSAALPQSSAILELESTNKGFLAPRVTLSSNTDATTISSPATGLLVYNTGTGGLTTAGYMFWNGTEWRTLEGHSLAAAAVTALQCSAAVLSPASTNGVSYTGTLTIPYTGGNGGTYAAASVTANGLTATRPAGRLNNGAGVLTYNVSGTPGASATTTFAISLGTASCNAVLNNGVQQQSAATIKTAAVIGPLVLTTDNGREGYALVINTPDGKFSVRTFIPTSSSFSQVNLQIRNNTASNVDIISNGHFLWSGAGGYQQNQLRLPPGSWAGDNATSSASLIDATTGARIQTASTNPYWGDPETYAGGMPEQRIYTWSSTVGTEKVFYKLHYMMGSSTPGSNGTTATCPGGTCNTTKAYFTIEEITAQ